MKSVKLKPGMKTKSKSSIRDAGYLFGDVVCLGAILFLAATINVPAQYNYTTLNVPGSSATFASGISGNVIVGDYAVGSGSYSPSEAFSYNINSGTYTSFSVPGAQETFAYAISGNIILGEYYNGSSFQGYLYNGSTFTTVTVPGASNTWVSAISGNNIVGQYYDASGYQDFLYNGNSYITLSIPGTISGISGDNIVGDYNNGSGDGFLYNINTGIYTSLSAPGGTATSATAIDGNSIVGYYLSGSDYLGFLYDISSGNYTSFGVPGAQYTETHGTDGSNIVGSYEDGASPFYGFLATPVPDPSILRLLAAGAAVLCLRPRWRKEFPPCQIRTAK